MIDSDEKARAKRKAHIRRVIDNAPPLTPERVARLAGLVFGSAPRKATITVPKGGPDATAS